jgi:hypothetical protein
MGKRSGVPDSKEEIAKLTIFELNTEIQRCLWGAEHGGTSQGRKAFFKRLVWLEKQREVLFGISAKKRAFRSR